MSQEDDQGGDLEHAEEEIKRQNPGGNRRRQAQSGHRQDPARLSEQALIERLFKEFGQFAEQHNRMRHTPPNLIGLANERIQDQT